MDSLQKSYLAETARWQKLLGVVMMVFTVLIALIGIFFIVAGSAFGDAMEGLDLFGGGMAGGPPFYSPTCESPKNDPSG